MSEGRTRGQLAKALASARAAAPWYVHKAGYNQHQRYAYAGHPDVMAHEGRRALSEFGLALVQVGVEMAGEIQGAKFPILLWRGRYLLIHESGEELPIEVMATTQVNDKVAFVASTSLDRTAWLRVLALAGSDDEDPEHTGDLRQDPDPRAQQAAQHAAARDQPAPIRSEVVALLKRLDTATAESFEAVRADALLVVRTASATEASEIKTGVENARKRLGLPAPQPAQKEVRA